MGPSGVSSQAAKSARGTARRRRAHDLCECVAEAAAGFIAGIELRHDDALAGADRLERSAEPARPGVFHEDHPEAFSELPAHGRCVDVERVEIRVAPAPVGLALHRIDQLAHDAGGLVGIGQRRQRLHGRYEASSACCASRKTRSSRAWTDAPDMSAGTTPRWFAPGRRRRPHSLAPGKG